MFFDFTGILPEETTMIERSKAFCDRAKSSNGWAFSCIVQYLQTLKEKVEKKEITAGTMKNRYQAVKLFCDMADIPIPWKKIVEVFLKQENLLMIEHLLLKKLEK